MGLDLEGCTLQNVGCRFDLLVVTESNVFKLNRFVKFDNFLAVLFRFDLRDSLNDFVDLLCADKSTDN